jgi:hypothetical protein
VNLKPHPAIVTVLPALHVVVCVATKARLLASEGSWGWFLVFLIDWPFSVVLLPLLKLADPLLVFGILGTAWWYLISRLGIYWTGRLLSSHRHGLPGGHFS